MSKKSDYEKLVSETVKWGIEQQKAHYKLRYGTMKGYPFPPTPLYDWCMKQQKKREKEEKKK